eukprot:CAMPEP_0180201244 /NCGR_PEP_ID=MMETSP0987-20121128/6645_1 /TAXON_ID=697907 /ORGANISM="non described non described, Strain CCMP2293" /LENGTH=53 /DNA_ID=CAMNT_0022156395 /DNA_START=139 /DNA_END=297 /DNA_ORIENTATION=-
MGGGGLGWKATLQWWVWIRCTEFWEPQRVETNTRTARGLSQRFQKTIIGRQEI